MVSIYVLIAGFSKIIVESIKIGLSQMNLNMDAEVFAEQACAEGELLQDGPNRWKRA